MAHDDEVIEGGPSWPNLRFHADLLLASDLVADARKADLGQLKIQRALRSLEKLSRKIDRGLIGRIQAVDADRTRRTISLKLFAIASKLGVGSPSFKGKGRPRRPASRWTALDAVLLQRVREVMAMGRTEHQAIDRTVTEAMATDICAYTEKPAHVMRLRRALYRSEDPAVAERRAAMARVVVEMRRQRGQN